MVAFLWLDIIRSDVRDEVLLYQELHDHMLIHCTNLMSEDDPVDLIQHLEKFPRPFYEAVAPKIRARVLYILSSPNNWKDTTIDNIHKLTNDERLFSRRDDLILVLDCVAKSENFRLLKEFPTFLANAYKSQGKDRILVQKTSDICTDWYRKILGLICGSVHSKKENIVYLVFSQLSRIYPVISDIERLWDRMQEIAIARTKDFDRDLIFKATSRVGNELEPKVGACFANFVKKRLDWVRNIDSQLKRAIMNICDCKDLVKLTVPNRWVEYSFFVLTSST